MASASLTPAADVVMRDLDDARPAAAGAAPSQSGSLSLLDGLQLSGASKADDSDQVNLVQALKQFWISEKAAPVLLQYEADTIEHITAEVATRQAKIDELRLVGSRHQFMLDILLQELDRVRFLLHSYHRCRLKKLEKFACYILANGQDDRCSPHELKFVQGYVNLMEQHFKDSFLRNVPEKMQTWFDVVKLDRNDPHIEAPDEGNSFITFRVKVEQEHTLRDNDAVDLYAGDIMVGSWLEFEELFRRDEIQLL